MGILFPDDRQDVDTLCLIMDASLADWNARFGHIEHVFLSLNQPSVEISSAVGGGMLAVHFPNQPDAYKRVATLLLMMTLHPFIIGRKQDHDGIYTDVIQGQILRFFGIQNAVDSVGEFFFPLQQLNDANEWIQLNQWPGFPSDETRDELVALLLSYSQSGIMTFKDRALAYDKNLLYQAILSVSLVLKQRYSV